MVELYGPNVPVDVKFAVIQAENFDSAQGNSTVHAKLGLECSFYVQYSNGTSI